MLSYPTVIVYMLQKTEYRFGKYFEWLHRSDDFRLVMKRQKLDRTKKARFLLMIAQIILDFVYILSFLMFVNAIILTNILLLLFAIGLFLISPLLVSYLIVVPLWIGYKLVQAPKQRKMIESTRDILKDHSGIKIAIAGSYGKTTAKEILGTIISEGKKVAFTPGNMNTPIGISRFVNTLKGDEDIIIFELGEEKVGDVKELCELVQPDIGIITGINEAHLSSFGTIEKTISTIFEISDYLGKKPIYKNKESILVKSKIDKNDKLAFSRKGVNNWTVNDINVSIDGIDFVVDNGHKKISMHTDLLGEHNIGIIMAAIDIASSLGLSLDQIKIGVEKTKPFEHRMQPRNLHGAWIIDDTYNGNSEGVQVGLELLKSLDANRRIYVTPGLVEQGDKTKEIHEKIGEQIADVVDVAVLMNNSVTEYIKYGLKRAGFSGKLIVIDDPLKFYSNLDQYVAKGDIMLMQNDWPDNYK